MNKFLVLFLLLGKLSFAQASYDKIVFYDDDNNETSSVNYKTKRVIKDFDLEKDCYQVLDYDIEDRLTFESTCTDKYTFARNGEFISYHENGSKKSITHYQNGKEFGEFLEWYDDGRERLIAYFINESTISGSIYIVKQFWNPDGKQEVVYGNGYFNYSGDKNSFQGNLVNGKKDGIWKGIYYDGLAFSEIYDNGKFVTGEGKDENDKKLIYTELEKKPEPKQGMEAYYKYIGKNFKYPKEAIKNNITGKIIIQFVVDKSGKVIDPKILRSAGYGLDEEAIRVVLSYTKWIPGQLRGRNVKVLYSLPLTLQSYE